MFVLIADHQSVFQKMLATILEANGVGYKMCGSGTELLQSMDEQVANLFVVSMNMPDMDGVNLCSRIRVKLQDDCIPIIILTSDSGTQRFSDVFDAGATDVFRRSNIQYFSAYIQRLAENTLPLEGRVMILEDSRSQRLILEDALTSWGIEVESFESCGPAYEAHLTNPFDVILTDIELKGLETGLDMVHDIRSQPFGVGDVPIIAITAYLSESTRVNFLARGIDRCLLKPILLPELRSELKNQLLSREIRLTLEQARQKERQANKAKSNFIARMSHELRTSLNAIIGFSELLGIQETTRREVSEYASKINDAGKLLLNLINEVLDLSRIEAGKVELTIEPLLLSDIFDRCSLVMAGFADEHRVYLDIQPPAKPVSVLCDETRIIEVLLNLISNAIKYNHQQGRVTVSVIILSDATLRINVVDSGVGIAPEDVDKIFEPFSRVHELSHETQGTGIGLPIAAQLMELMNGDLGFSSKLNEGSDFWVDIPLDPKSGQRIKNAKHNQSVGKLLPCSVIYVDDNPVNRLLIEKWFAKQDGASIALAEAARDGLALAHRVHPDIIITDINMPGESGYWLLERIHHSSAFSGVPVVALSAMAMCDEVKLGEYSEFDAYITKPIDFNVLTKTINKLVGP